MEALAFRLEVFEGPLDLLLSLISKNKVEISDIPIAVILDQYLEYLDRMREFNAEISGDFIVTASELMLIKSRMLLPGPEREPEEDPRRRLAEALLEYRQAKEHALLLRDRYECFAGRLTKDTEVIDVSGDLPEGLDPMLLQRAFNKILKRNSALPQLARKSEEDLSRLLKTRVVPVQDKVWSILRMLYREGAMCFETMLLRARSRSELIAMFLALLELVKAGRVTLSEDGEDILLTLNLEKRTTKSEGETNRDDN